MSKDKRTQITCFFFILGNRVLILWVQLVNVFAPRIILSLVHSNSLVQLRLSFGIDKTFVKFHPICKRRTLLPLALESNCTIELLNDLLWNNESKNDTTSVNFLGTLNKPKKFEQLALVFPLNTQTSVFNLDLYIRLAIRFVERVVNRHGSIFLCKLEGIWLDIHKHLLETSPISMDHQRLVRLFSFDGKIIIKQLTLKFVINVTFLCIRIIKYFLLLWFLVLILE